jgi:Ca-activated chloride channel family protein
MNLGPVHIAHPQLFWLAVIVAPLYVFLLHVYDHARRAALTRRLGELPVLGRVIGSASHGRRIIKDILFGLGFSALLFAASRPQLEGMKKMELRGLDLVLAIDVSKSMLVDDVAQTSAMKAKRIDASRLARARELATAVIEELPGDRIGPMVFAGAATSFPLTEDHQVAARFLTDLGPTDLPPGSNLGEVFRVARCMLRPDLYEDLGCKKIGKKGHGGDPLRGESLDPPEAKTEEKLEQEVERGKAIVIITDGGDADAKTIREVATAKELGIAVFLVGVGSERGGVVYEIDPYSGKRTTTPKKMPDGSTVVSKRDDAAMKAIAGAAGDENRYIPTDEKAPEVDLATMAVVDALRAVNRGLATKQVKEMRDIYQPFLFLAFMLLVIEVAISTRRRQTYPEAR